jgi:O-antigen/teichoic acid export membrane protein
MNLWAAGRYLRLSAFDSSTEQGRSAERYRMAAWSVVASVLSKGMSLTVIVMSVSLTLPYLGAERFGVWMTISSFVALLAFMDLGVGNALTNRVAQSAARNEPLELQRTITGGVGFLLLIGTGMAFFLYLIATWLPWSALIKASSPAVLQEARRTAQIFAALFGAHMVSTGVQKVFAGLQRAFEGHLASVVSAFIAAAGVFLAAKQEAGIPVLLAVTFGSQSLSGALLLGRLLKRNLFAVADVASALKHEALGLISTGGLFLALQIGTMAGWGADSLIISSTLGAAQVTVYAITQRLFQFVTQPLSIINAPLWPAYADAHARDDKAFIRATLRRSLGFTVAAGSLGAVAFVVIGEPLISLWTNATVAIPRAFIFLFGIATVVEAAGNSLAMCLNGCGLVRPQVVAVIALSVLSLPIKLITCSWGGLSYLVASYTLTYIAVLGVAYGRVFRRDIAALLA